LTKLITGLVKGTPNLESGLSVEIDISQTLSKGHIFKGVLNVKEEK